MEEILLFNANYGDHTTLNEKVVIGEDGLVLTEVLEAFLTFLHGAGYPYIDQIVAVCGDIEHATEL
jgi:hypothetical protein